MNLYFVRHGQSILSQQGIHQFYDTPLSPTGIKQARALANYLTKISLNLIIASPLTRAYSTALIIKEKNDKPLITSKFLEEIKRPTSVQGKSKDDPQVIKIKKQIKLHQNDKNWHYEDEDNFFDLKTKALNFITYIKTRKEENILIVAHGTIISLIIFLLLEKNIRAEQFFRIHKLIAFDNTGITKCEYSSKGFKLIFWNNTPHLS